MKRKHLDIGRLALGLMSCATAAGFISNYRVNVNCCGASVVSPYPVLSRQWSKGTKLHGSNADTNQLDEQLKCLNIMPQDISEHFVRGSGKGGQNVNKLNNCVVLYHRPSKTQIRCHTSRSLHENRKLARQLLLKATLKENVRLATEEKQQFEVCVYYGLRRGKSMKPCSERTKAGTRAIRKIKRSNETL